MGDMEMIDKHGVKATFTDAGIELDIVPFNECCQFCNDPRILNEDGLRKCVACGCNNDTV